MWVWVAQDQRPAYFSMQTWSQGRPSQSLFKKKKFFLFFISVAVIKYPDRKKLCGEMVYLSSQFQVAVYNSREDKMTGIEDSDSCHT